MNFKNAIDQYEKILKIYSKNKNSEEYLKVKESISHLEKDLKHQLKNMKNKEPENFPILTDLKKTMKNQRKLTEDDQRSEHSFRSDDFMTDF